MKKLCKFPGCCAVAMRGAYVLPKPPEEKLFTFVLLCHQHGQLAMDKGAKKMDWRPNP
jgi:hypothetical protein